jgi:hypothetical protein
VPASWAEPRARPPDADVSVERGDNDADRHPSPPPSARTSSHGSHPGSLTYFSLGPMSSSSSLFSWLSDWLRSLFFAKELEVSIVGSVPGAAPTSTLAPALTHPSPGCLHSPVCKRAARPRLSTSSRMANSRRMSCRPSRSTSVPARFHPCHRWSLRTRPRQRLEGASNHSYWSASQRAIQAD